MLYMAVNSRNGAAVKGKKVTSEPVATVETF